MSDTVGHTIKVGVCPYLSDLIDSAWISMIKYENGNDSVIVIKKFSSEIDTQWYDFSFSSAKICSVSVKAFIQGGIQYVVNGVITIFGKPVSGSIKPAIDTLPVDSLIMFSVEAGGDGPFTYQWFHDSTLLTAKTGVWLSISNLTYADSGTYSCLIMDKWGDTAMSNHARLLVVPKTVVKVNTKPVLSVSGRKNILIAEICTLTVSAADSDSGQTQVFAVAKGPVGYSFVGTLFIWTPPTGYLGTDSVKVDTAIFTVTDDGQPPLSDTQKVAIVVSAKILLPESVKGITAISRINGSFLFTWNKSNNADQYAIYRSRDTTGFILFSTTPDTFFTNAIKDTAFYYYVIATNSKASTLPSLRIRSTAINTAPKWSHDAITISINEGASFSMNCADSCKDANGDSVSFQLVSAGLVSDSLVGTTWNYTPSYTDSGLHTVKIKAADGIDSSVLTISVHVVNVARSPLPQPQNLSTKRNTPLQITLTATDPDGDAITLWVLDTVTTHGSAVLTSASQPAVTYTPAVGFIGTDYFTFKASAGNLSSTYSAKVTIKVDTSNIAPKISQKLSAKTLNKGDSLVLTIAINQDAFPAPWYYWHKADSLLDSTQVNSWKKTNLSAADSGYYYVIVSNGAGRDSSGAHFGVNVSPVITSQPTAQTVTSGAPATFTVVANGIPVPTYLWKKNGSNCTGASATTATFTISAVSITDTGNYSVDVMNVADTITSNAVRLTANVPPTIITQPQGQRILEHLSINLSVNATGNTPLTYQWRNNGTDLTVNATGSTYTKANALPADSGDYTIIITNSIKSCTSSVAHVSVVPTYTLTTASLPLIGGSMSRSKDTIAYPRGDTVTLTATAATGYRFTGWTGDISGTTSPAKLPMTGVKTVYANFIKQFSLTIIVPQGGTVTKTPNQTMYDSNSTVTLNASAASTYNFYGWTGDTTVQSNSFSIVMNSNKNLLANIIHQYNWTAANSGLTDTIVKALAANGNVIYAGSADSGVYRSINGGTSWNKMDTGLSGLCVYSLACMGSIVFAGTDVGTFLSKDSAKTWQVTANPWNGWPCYALGVKGTGIYGGTLGAIHFTADSGKTWTQEPLSIAGQIYSIAINGNTILAGDRGNINQSQDDGSTWYNRLTLSYLTPYSFNFNGTNVFAGSPTYGIFRSSDTGTTWTRIDTTIYTRALASYSSSIFAGGMKFDDPNGFSDIFISIDNGNHWYPQGFYFNVGVNALAVVGKTIFVGVRGGCGLYQASIP
jgi:uncharacterized repeat protein (TIGR02543 family)